MVCESVKGFFSGNNIEDGVAENFYDMLTVRTIEIFISVCCWASHELHLH